MNFAEIAMLPKNEKILVGIATKDRPEYVSILLSSLLYQTEQAFDILIVENGVDDIRRYVTSPLERLLKTLDTLGHEVSLAYVPCAGNSEVAAVNYILTEAVFKGYKYVYKTDDDHILQPDLLERLKKAHMEMEKKHGCPVMTSALTPFMHKTGPGMSDAGHPYTGGFWEPDKKLTKIIIGEDKNVSIDIGHFNWFMEEVGILESDLASNANFLMRPDARILWEDIGHCSMNADAVWMVQNRVSFGYKFFFDSGCVSWHITAPSGGVRDSDDDYAKKTHWDERRRQHFAYIVDQLLTE